MVDTQGDAYFATFGRAKDAVAGAAAAQRALAAHVWPDGVEVRVRMGLHSGEPSVSEAGFVSLAIHRAARISAAAHGGQVVMSSTTRDLVEDEVPAGATLRDLGDYRLKDLDRPERIHQLVLAGLAADFPPLRTGELAEAARTLAFRSRLGAMRGHARRRAVLATAILALGALGAGVLVLSTRSSSAETLAAVAPNSVGIVDPRRNAIVGQVEVGPDPVEIAAGSSGIWVTIRGNLTLARIDPSKRAVVESFGVPQPNELAVGRSTIWLSSEAPDYDVKWLPERQAGRGQIYSIDVTQGDELLKATGLALDGTSLWVGSEREPSLVRIDQASKRVIGRTPLESVGGVAVDRNGVWASVPSANRLARVDPVNGAVDYVLVGMNPDRVAATGTSIWVLNTGDDTVSRVSVGPYSATVGATIPVRGLLVDVAVGGGAVWVADARGRRIVRIDPRANAVAASIPLGGRPERIAFARGLLWVTVRR